MSPGSPELAEAVARYGKPDSAEQASRAAEERADVLARFPVASWPELPLERYALGSVDEPVPYCVMLEYRTPYLGSIKGGSARKHIIYRPNVGGWWVAGPLEELEPHQAWERLRHEFVQAITAAMAGDVEDFERFPLLRWGPALVTKTLAIYAPDHFLRVYSADHMRRFIRLFGGTPVPEAPSWVLNRQLKMLIAADPEFGSWDQEQVFQFLYTYLDPRAGDLTVTKIEPGENGRLWTECLAGQTSSPLFSASASSCSATACGATTSVARPLTPCSGADWTFRARSAGATARSTGCTCTGSTATPRYGRIWFATRL